MKIITRDGHAFSPEMTADPTYSYIDGYGYGQAKIPCVLPAEDLRGAVVRLDLAVPWYGVIIDPPKPGDALSAVGFGVVGTYGRRAATFCDSSTSAWQSRPAQGMTTVWRPQTAFDRLEWNYDTDAAWTTGTAHGFIYRLTSPLTSVVLKGTLALNIANHTCNLFVGVDGAGSVGEGIAWTSKGTVAAGAVNATITNGSAFSYVLVQVQCASGNHGPTASPGVLATFTGPKVYATGVTSATATAIVSDVLTNEIDPFYLPAGRLGFIAADTTLVEPCVFANSSANVKLDELAKYSAYRFGWYTEKLGVYSEPLPHWEPVPTEPSYILDLADATSSDFDTAAFEPLYSAVDVTWTDAAGHGNVTRTYDTDATHRLVQLGMNTATTAKVTELSVQTESAATAATIGALAAAAYGRDQVRGSGTFPIVRDMGGNIIPASSVRPNRIARVYGLDKPVNVMVRECEGTGDAVCKITLDTDSYALDVALAQLSKRSVR